MDQYRQCQLLGCWAASEMYSPLGHTATTRANKLNTIKSWWLLLTLFLAFLLLMFLNLSNSQIIVSPSIKPLAQINNGYFFTTDALYNNISKKALDISSERVDSSPVLSSCSKPITKVGFMKTHKTASSTVQNIIMRYGMHSEWNFAMYGEGSHLGPPSQQYKLTRSFTASWLERVPWAEMVHQQGGYNVFALHTKWDQNEVERVLGRGTAKYFTILRDPVAEFESLYNYAHFDKVFHMNLESFIHTFIGGGRRIQRVNSYLGRNQQLWDLGLGARNLTNQQAVREKIQELELGLNLVMLAEQFDTSLVLLADTLCWPLYNMTSLKLNARKGSAIEKLSPQASAILKDWLWADYMLYDHFKLEFERKKTLYGLPKLQESVNKLNEYNEKVKRECVLEVVKDTNKLSEDFIPWSKDVMGFRVDEGKDYCKYFGISELHFIDKLRELQLERLLRWQAQNSY